MSVLAHPSSGRIGLAKTLSEPEPAFPANAVLHTLRSTLIGHSRSTERFLPKESRRIYLTRLWLGDQTHAISPRSSPTWWN